MEAKRPRGGSSSCPQHSFAFVAVFCLCILLAPVLDRQSHGFWAQGHHAIAVLAFEMLEPQEQNKLIELLKHHPRFEQDFTIPDSIQGDQEGIHRWWIGIAGEWPDLIRGNEKYDRPTWHYQLGASVVIGDVEVPDDPGPLPDDATMETRELYIVQAIELCKKVLHDESQPKADRALAICWLAHLVADAHQPCHAGSLYSPKAFPNGDRGANLIPIKGQGDIRNLHAFWDSLLGAEATTESVEKRVEMINKRGAHGFKDGAYTEDPADMPNTTEASGIYGELKNVPGDPHDWLEESRRLASGCVYEAGVLGVVLAIERDFVGSLHGYAIDATYSAKATTEAEMMGYRAAARLRAIFVN